MLTSGWPIMEAPESFARRHQHRFTTPKQGSEQPETSTSASYHPEKPAMRPWVVTAARVLSCASSTTQSAGNH